MKNMWIFTRPIQHVLNIDVLIEPTLSFVTEDDFAMNIIIVAHLFQSPIEKCTSLQVVIGFNVLVSLNLYGCKPLSLGKISHKIGQGDAQERR